MRVWLISLLLLLGLLQGCAVNPVTGEQELSLVSESQELAIGEKQYRPTRQSQGGDYKLDPELSRYVNKVGQRLAAVSDRKLPYEFTVLNDSTPNAWALPGGKIAVNRGLLVELNSEAELAAVLGHEIVHAAARHGAQGIERGMLLQGALIATGVAMRDSDYGQLAVGAAAVGANLVNQKYGRDAEREADHYGMTYMVRAGYDPQAAVSLQETFVRLSEERRENWLSGLFASHPPSRERVENNRRTAAELKPAKARVGREDYQKAIAGLIRTKPAYDAYDDAREALDKGDERRALALVDKAIRIEPREAQFHTLRGEILDKQGHPRDALAEYDEALRRDNDFFRPYLLRGDLRERLGDRAGAERDLERSLALLPTSDAHLALGELALAGGREDAAVEHFRTAASGSNSAAKSANRSLVRLDMPRNPSRYLDTRLGVDRSGRLLVQVSNGTPLTVRDVRVSVGRRQGPWLRPLGEYRLSGTLPAGRSVTLRTDIGPVQGNQLGAYGVQIDQAQVVDK